jgi:thymidylate synthase (FAD)
MTEAPPPDYRPAVDPLPEGYIRCLDHGYVGLVRHMGDDQFICDAARRSISGKNVRAHSDETALLRYLFRHRHTSPFEMGQLVFDMYMPMFVARQWVRHRTAKINEMSARYGVLPEKFYVPKPEDINVQATKNKQGRGTGVLDDYHAKSFAGEAATNFVNYDARLEAGMARELARINLPLSTYTGWWWSCDLHNIFHLLSLRKNPHAQMEIRVYADAVGHFVQEKFPIAYKAFEDFRLNAVTFSAQEMQALMYLFKYQDEPGGDVSYTRDFFPTQREFEEFKTKIEDADLVD